MWLMIGAFFNWLSRQSARLARWCGHQPPPMVAQTPWQMMAQGRMGLRVMTEEASNFVSSGPSTATLAVPNKSTVAGSPRWTISSMKCSSRSCS
jgi:hypothetical protein